MFKIYFYNGLVSVALGVDDGNESAPQEWEGDQNLIGWFKSKLETAYGAFGHLFGTEFATPIDLHYAVFSNLAVYDPVVVEGAELVETYDPGIPEGAIT